MIKIVIPDDALVEAMRPLPASIELVALGLGEEPAERVLGAEVIIFAAQLRHLLPRFGDFADLRLVQSLNAGIEWLLPSVPAGVTLCNASGVHDGPVADWAVAVILATYRELPRYFEAQRQEHWDLRGNALIAAPDAISGDDLDAKTVLIVGHGSIGRAIEARLAPFGVRTVGVAKHARPGVLTPDELPDLLPRADVVIMLAPLTDTTRGMVDATFLARMANGALLVNAARGPVVDHEALLAELRTERLRAALDVTEPEPLPDGHPLWSAPGCIITPHTAGSVRQWLERSYRFAGDQLRRHAGGEALLNVRSEY